MKSLKKLIARFTIAVALAAPLTAGTMIGANAAEALTTTSYNYSVCVGTSLWAVTDTRYDYNWFEELQGYRDYWTRYYRYRIAYNHPICIGPIRPA